ncbi:SPFH domain-containing protein [Ectothiorhodospira lacustris]|uniref:SPFH domain-containing protein n=1 Tax=Ectothiorhodospira lacustris TaxID=2899127 RepID=UPI001EE95F84|nr:SPFH domain-containing protein [Ectothiorhodospira lacustris]MCG5499759.1 SPFH/Band 7/PHB domain protein [Ectothiorhodospira lacustris]MCG5509784.1 SPFH/Band 7/PHB domain protein [Ectothiorhodospira lacustris]MCG5522302.1 SPFH/Band 7/PHB domain protein [Ectothiorhodospira lacustris]
MEAFGVFATTIVVVTIIFIAKAVKAVPQGEKWTVERFGRYTRTLESGLSIIVPFIDSIGRKLTVMEQVLDVPAQTVITKDNVAVVADGVVFFRIDDAASAAYQVRNLEEAIVNLTTTNLRSVIGSMDLDDTLSNRSKINDVLMGIVDDATNPWGVKIVRIEIRDLKMEPELQKAMNMQMTAERKRRAQVLEATGRREAEILQAEGEKQAAILRAEGERQAAFLEAEAREREAKAEAEATRVVSEAIAAGNIQAVQYFLGIKYVEALQQIGKADNSKLVLMPLEASGITGAVAGITELVQQMGADNKALPSGSSGK